MSGNNFINFRENTNNQFVNNKEQVNNKLFERNNFNAQIFASSNHVPHYFNEGYNKNRKDAVNMFETRFMPEIYNNSKPNLGSIDFSKDKNIQFDTKKLDTIIQNNLR